MSLAALQNLFVAHLGGEGAAWFRDAVVAVRESEASLRARWSAAGRNLGRQPIIFSGTEVQELTLAGSHAPGGWGADECGRVLLLAAAFDVLPEGRHQALIEELYRTGELRERQALLRGLSYFPGPERFVALAVESVRENALSLLEAIACDNPFPARFFPEGAFNQMIVKALLNGISLSRVHGLETRRSQDLSRMVAAFVSERRAAGRAVPLDVALVLKGDEHASV